MVRRRLDAEEARELIIKEAGKLFIEKGFTHATMDELRTRCGMSKGNLYYHFKTKDEIFVQVIIKHSDSVMERFNKRTRGFSSVSEKLMIMAEIWGEECKNPYVQFMDEYVREIKIDEDQIQLLYQAIRRKSEAIEKMIEEAIATGEIKGDDSGSISSCVFSMLEGTSLLCMSLLEENEGYYVRVHRDNMKMLLNGLKGGLK